MKQLNLNCPLELLEVKETLALTNDDLTRSLFGNKEEADKYFTANGFKTCPRCRNYTTTLYEVEMVDSDKFEVCGRCRHTLQEMNLLK